LSELARRLRLTKEVAAFAQHLAALLAPTREAIAQRETTIARVQRESKATTAAARDFASAPRLRGLLDEASRHPRLQRAHGGRQRGDGGREGGEIGHQSGDIRFGKPTA
jgi:hypothetical protein